jgi:hypothetical protein
MLSLPHAAITRPAPAASTRRAAPAPLRPTRQALVRVVGREDEVGGAVGRNGLSPGLRAPLSRPPALGVFSLGPRPSAHGSTHTLLHLGVP